MSLNVRGGGRRRKVVCGILRAVMVEENGNYTSRSVMVEIVTGGTIKVERKRKKC